MRISSIPSSRRSGIIICLLIFGFIDGVACLHAQPTQSEVSKFQPLQTGTDIYSFTGSLNWHTYYYVGLTSNKLEKNSETGLHLKFRHINMLSPHVGLGYKFFSTIFMYGFFEGASVGGAGAGPLLRYYPLKNTRWQPYLQGSLSAGYNLALGSSSSFPGNQTFRFRNSLKAGLTYKFSNTFGLFFEIGPGWEYTSNFQLDSHTLLINVGIELFQF